MADIDASETNADRYEPPPFRDRLPTIPHDLSEYALTETGPTSWSAEHDGAPFSRTGEQEPLDPLDPLDAMTTGDLLDVRPSDVPYLALTLTELAAHELDAREALVLSLLDGSSTLESMLEITEINGAELLTTVCELCARGIVTLQRKS
jgi:hypothetical protein